MHYQPDFALEEAVAVYFVIFFRQCPGEGSVFSHPAGEFLPGGPRGGGPAGKMWEVWVRVRAGN